MILALQTPRTSLDHLSQCHLGAHLGLCISEIWFQLRILEMTDVH